jgi:hypothetical protein
MKKIGFLLPFVLIICTAQSQNVGIGTTTPLMRLHVVNGDSAIALFENTQALNLNVKNALYFKTGNGSYNYTGAIKTIGEGTSEARLAFFTYSWPSPNGLMERLSIADDGRVCIGTTTPSVGYKLTVGGRMICTELKVQLQPFPDYVFDEKYKLKTIREVEDHIKTFRRLPGMPAAAEIEKNGMNVGEMEGKLVEKVEELTLYIIQLQKQIDELKKIVTAAKK